MARSIAAFAVRTTPSDVIVADNVMPLMSGVELWRVLASYLDYNFIAFLFRSAVHTLPADVRPAAFLRKPYAPKQPIDLLRQWTGH